MDISEIREKKMRLGMAIDKLIEAFEEETGTRVKSMDFERVTIDVSTPSRRKTCSFNPTVKIALDE